MKHTLTPSDWGLLCPVCGQQWRKPPVSPCPGLRVYGWETAPATLKTKTQLGKLGLKLAPGQAPAGCVPSSKAPHGHWLLYDETAAIPKRQPTPAQLAALEKGRAAQLAARTCQRCGFVDSDPLGGQLCEWCARADRLRADHQRVVESAKALLASPTTWVVLDTETTGLDHSAEIVQLAVVASDGTALVDTLIKPAQPIPPSASAIHHITDELVSTAPTFAEVYPRLIDVVQGKGIVAYNAKFDRRMVNRACDRAGLSRLPNRWACAMVEYAAFCGDYSDYWEDYKWQPLPGGDHSAVGDCRATLRLITQMASAPPA